MELTLKRHKTAMKWEIIDLKKVKDTDMWENYKWRSNKIVWWSGLIELLLGLLGHFIKKLTDVTEHAAFLTK